MEIATAFCDRKMTKKDELKHIANEDKPEEWLVMGTKSNPIFGGGRGSLAVRLPKLRVGLALMCPARRLIIFLLE